MAAISNGGFETGDFTGWTHYAVGHAVDPAISSESVRTGTYAAKLIVDSELGEAGESNASVLTRQLDLTGETQINISYNVTELDLGGGTAIAIWIYLDNGVDAPEMLGTITTTTSGYVDAQYAIPEGFDTSGVGLFCVLTYM